MAGIKAGAKARADVVLSLACNEVRQAKLAQIERKYTCAFSNLRCGICIDHALDDDYAGQITDDEELDRLHHERRARRKNNWLRDMMAPR